MSASTARLCVAVGLNPEKPGVPLNGSCDRVAVEVDEVAVRVGDLVAVVRHGSGRRRSRGDVLRAEERLVAVVAARLGRQQVRRPARRASRAESRSPCAQWIASPTYSATWTSLNVVRVRGGLRRFGRVRPEHGRHVDGRVLEHHVRGREVADRAARTRERHPRRRRDAPLAGSRRDVVRVDHRRRVRRPPADWSSCR